MGLAEESFLQTQKKIVLGLVLVLFLSTTALIKFAIPLGGDNQVFFSIVVIYFFCGVGLLTSTLYINPTQLALSTLLLGGLLATQLLGGTTFSILSYLYMVTVLLPYIFKPKEGLLRPGAELVLFQNLMSCFALLGILQFFLQFIIGADWAFFVDTKFPAEIVKQHYNSMNALGYGSTVYKSTAFLMQEPSNFSQLLAIAILIELIYFMSLKRLMLYVLALSLTFSGTGLIILFVLGPFYLIYKRRFGILFSGILLVFTLPFWGEYVGLGYTINRIEEFGSTNSSAFARFISPFMTINNKLFSQDIWNNLFGLGAGSMMRTMGTGVDYEVANASWSKLLYEYGFVGGLLFYAYMGYLMFSGRKNLFLIFAITIQFYFLGEYVSSPTVHVLILAFLVWPSTTRDDKIETNGKFFLQLKRFDDKSL